MLHCLCIADLLSSALSLSLSLFLQTDYLPITRGPTLQWRSRFPFFSLRQGAEGETSCSSKQTYSGAAGRFSSVVLITPGCPPHPATLTLVLFTVWRQRSLSKLSTCHFINALLSLPVFVAGKDTVNPEPCSLMYGNFFLHFPPCRVLTNQLVQQLRVSICT